MPRVTAFGFSQAGSKPACVPALLTCSPAHLLSCSPAHLPACLPAEGTAYTSRNGFVGASGGLDTVPVTTTTPAGVSGARMCARAPAGAAECLLAFRIRPACGECMPAAVIPALCCVADTLLGVSVIFPCLQHSLQALSSLRAPAPRAPALVPSSRRAL